MKTEYPPFLRAKLKYLALFLVGQFAGAKLANCPNSPLYYTANFLSRKI